MINCKGHAFFWHFLYKSCNLEFKLGFKVFFREFRHQIWPKEQSEGLQWCVFRHYIEIEAKLKKKSQRIWRRKNGWHQQALRRGTTWRLGGSAARRLGGSVARLGATSIMAWTNGWRMARFNLVQLAISSDLALVQRVCTIDSGSSFSA